MSIINLYTNIWTVTQTLVHTEHILSFISHYSMQTWAQTTQNMKSLITVLKCIFEHPSVMFCVALYLSIHADMFCVPLYLSTQAAMFCDPLYLNIQLSCFVFLCIWTSNGQILCSYDTSTETTLCHTSTSLYDTSTETTLCHTSTSLCSTFTSTTLYSTSLVCYSNTHMPTWLIHTSPAFCSKTTLIIHVHAVWQ